MTESSHTCPPRWVVCCRGGAARTVYAVFAEGAAEQWAIAEEAAEGVCIAELGETVTLDLWIVGHPVMVATFTVRGEMVPKYTCERMGLEEPEPEPEPEPVRPTTTLLADPEMP